MFIKIRAILLVVTLTSYTQTVEEPMPYNITTKPKSDNLSDDFIMKRTQESSKNPNKKVSTFENYLKKFEPSTIWEQLDKKKKYNGLVISEEEHLEIIMKAMDPTDEIMEFKVENGNPKLYFGQGGRRGQLGWRPVNEKGYVRDAFNLRNHIYELMKQAIYTTRDKMIVMQIYRAKYRDSPLYKMGFLMQKADTAVKNFGKFSHRAYRACLLARERVIFRLNIMDFMSINEKQLNMWFNIQILSDLIFKNDHIVHEIFKNYTTNRTKHMEKFFID